MTTTDKKSKKPAVEEKKISSTKKTVKKGKTPVIAKPKAEAISTGSPRSARDDVKKTGRSGKYKDAKKLVDPTKLYPIKDAVALVKKLSISSFDGNVDAHLVTTETGDLGGVNFPHLKTVAKKVVIANDSVLAKIKKGDIDFDVLIATPVTMPKLLPFARVLGPKGLMPNPKAGTLTDNPKEAKAKMESGTATPIKTEKKAPLVHIKIGKVSQTAKELQANLEALITTIRKERIKKIALTPTMGPSVKVLIER